MEISVYPRTFTVQPQEVRVAEGIQQAMRVTVMDVSGTVFHLTFGAGDWVAFQAAVADHEKFGEEMKAAAKAAEARALLLGAASPIGHPTTKRTP